MALSISLPFSLTSYCGIDKVMSSRKPKRTKGVVTHTARTKANGTTTVEMVKNPTCCQMKMNLTDSQQTIINDLRANVEHLERELSAEKMKRETQKVVVEMMKANIASLTEDKASLAKDKASLAKEKASLVEVLDNLLATHSETVTALASCATRNLQTPVSPPPVDSRSEEESVETVPTKDSVDDNIKWATPATDEVPVHQGGSPSDQSFEPTRPDDHAMDTRWSTSETSSDVQPSTDRDAVGISIHHHDNDDDEFGSLCIVNTGRTNATDCKRIAAMCAPVDAHRLPSPPQRRPAAATNGCSMTLGSTAVPPTAASGTTGATRSALQCGASAATNNAGMLAEETHVKFDLNKNEVVEYSDEWARWRKRIDTNQARASRPLDESSDSLSNPSLSFSVGSLGSEIESRGSPAWNLDSLEASIRGNRMAEPDNVIINYRE